MEKGIQGRFDASMFADVSFPAAAQPMQNDSVQIEPAHHSPIVDLRELPYFQPMLVDQIGKKQVVAGKKMVFCWAPSAHFSMIGAPC